MRHFIGFYDYTVILTYLSLVSAVCGMTLASRGLFGWAIICLMISGVCDAFDGIVARSKKNRTQDEKSFGIQIDSLCDAVSFGVFPAFLGFHMGMNTIPGIAIVCGYVLCAVIRLAFFNVMEEKRQQTETGSGKVYRGMPVTTVSIILPPIYLTRSLLGPDTFVVLMHGILALCALLFILDFPVKKIDWMKALRGPRK